MSLFLLGPRTLTYYRADADVNVGGLPAPAVWTPATLRGSWQPLSSTQRQALPEGLRASASAKIYTSEILHTAEVEEVSGRRADILERDGVYYRITARIDYGDHMVPTQHQKYLLTTVDPDSQDNFQP